MSARNIIFEEHFDRFHQTDTYFEQRHNREELELALAQKFDSTVMTFSD